MDISPRLGMPLPESKARELAEAKLAELASHLDGAVAINDQATKYINGHWVFAWNSVDYLEGRDDDAALAGNHSIIVRETDGEVWTADIRRSLEDQLA
jgi:hypothetical protein